MSYENLSFSELSQEAELLLKQSVSLSDIKKIFLDAGHSLKTYEAIERILYSKSLVPLTGWEKAKKQIYGKLGLVKIDPKKKGQAVFSIIICLVLMIYFIAVFRNLDKGPFYAFTNNPLRLAFDFSMPKNNNTEIDFVYIEAINDSDLRGADLDLQRVEKLEIEVDLETTILPEIDTKIDGYILSEKQYFDTVFKNWELFLWEIDSYLTENSLVIFDGEIVLNKNKSVSKFSFLARNNQKTIQIIFDEKTQEEVLFFEAIELPKILPEQEIPIISFLKKIQSIAKTDFYNGVTKFSILPNSIIDIAFEAEDDSHLEIEYFIFNDSITQQRQIGFKNLPVKSNGIFETLYPVKRTGPRPSGFDATRVSTEEILEESVLELESKEKDTEEEVFIEIENLVDALDTETTEKNVIESEPMLEIESQALNLLPGETETIVLEE